MNISSLKVMHSNAGYYLGRSYYDEDVKADLPYSRESGYYHLYTDAKIALTDKQQFQAN